VDSRQNTDVLEQNFIQKITDRLRW